MRFEIYCLDKLEGLIACEHGFLDRNYCDSLEKQAFLKTVDASALLVDPTPNADVKGNAFVRTADRYDWLHMKALGPAQGTVVDDCDFVFVHYQEASSAHYDPVYVQANDTPRILREAVRRRIVDLVLASECC